MAVEVIAGTPLADELQKSVQPKLVEMGWSTGAADDSALSEYIILMLVNGKTQEEVASDLASDLLGLDSEDQSAAAFAKWLFEEVNRLGGGSEAQTQPHTAIPDVQHPEMEQMDTAGTDGTPAAQDMNMGEGGPPGTAPTGPKSMRNRNGNGVQSPRDRRMLGQLNKAMDRSGDASLHRIRGAAGAGRINQHGNRQPPKGPKSMQDRMQNVMNGRPMGMGGPPGVNPQMGQTGLNLSAQQQMQMLKLLEEQSRIMAQALGQNAPAINPAFFGGGMQNSQPPAGKSLFERVQKPRHNGLNKGRPPQQDNAMDTDTPMNGDSAQSGPEEHKSPFDIMCRFNKSCTRADCPYAHQSPAAPEGTTVDLTDTCSFGAACQNFKCSGKHPSPGQRRQHATTIDCKFYPNCTNPRCPFRHPSTPPCRNGADCPQKDKGCKFSHSAVQCRYNPCLNPQCPFVHSEGQKRGAFEDKVWTAEGFDRESAEKADKAHLSDRKFVAEGEGDEELILPGRMGDASEAASSQSLGQADIVT